MEKKYQSIALVQRTEGNSTRFLLRWQPVWQRWEFIVGQRLNNESFRETIIREIGWQLRLSRSSDFIVSSMAQLSLEFSETLPDQASRQVAIAFYHVHIYRAEVLDYLIGDANNRWVSAAEICAGQSDDGDVIHPEIVAWINRWKVVQPWQ